MDIFLLQFIFNFVTLLNMNKKVILGQFFTKNSVWLQPQVCSFIINSGCSVAYDPFAGAGDLLKAVSHFGFKEKIGLDIDSSLKWKYNDSLKNIPTIQNAIIITNPPYLAKQSATRKNIDYSQYFNQSKYDDLYLIGLKKMLQAQKYVVAIIPESFLNSNFQYKNLLHSVTILEDNPFEDTENPVCVVCFDGVQKSLQKVLVYKNDEFVNNLDSIQKIRLIPQNILNIRFNDKTGWLGLRAIDSTDDKNWIHFDFKEAIKYDWDNNIKISSRHMSLINLDIPLSCRRDLISTANQILNKIRHDSCDILLTPFKGNTKSGIRRRRLDFRLARAVLERAYINNTRKEFHEQFGLF